MLFVDCWCVFIDALHNFACSWPCKQSPVCCYVLQVNASGEQVLVERPESAAVTPSRSVQVGMQPTLEVAVDLPQQAQPAHLAMQWQESQAGNNAWSRVSDSTLTYELIERSLRQRGELTALAFVFARVTACLRIVSEAFGTF